MVPIFVLIIRQRRWHGTRHSIEGEFVEADLLVGVVRWCVFGGLAISLGSSAVFEVTEDGGARGIEEGFECRDGGGYDADVDFEAGIRWHVVSMWL